MKVVLIGAGNVATQFAKELYSKSFDIVQVYSRTLASASALAKKVDAAPITDISLAVCDADLYIFSVKDSVLEGLIASLPSNNGLWAHTAGSMSINVFKGYTSRYGVLYPFQTFSKDRKVDWTDIPVFLEASDDQALEQLKSIASQLSTKIVELSTEERKYLHLTGVFACNFTNHMYALSKQVLAKINLPFDIALPLIDETASKVHSLSPEEAQTGPAVRFDENVMEKHLSLIDDDKIKQIYKLMSESIHRFGKKDI